MTRIERLRRLRAVMDAKSVLEMARLSGIKANVEAQRAREAARLIARQTENNAARLADTLNPTHAAWLALDTKTGLAQQRAIADARVPLEDQKAQTAIAVGQSFVVDKMLDMERQANRTRRRKKSEER